LLLPPPPPPVKKKVGDGFDERIQFFSEARREKKKREKKRIFNILQSTTPGRFLFLNESVYKNINAKERESEVKNAFDTENVLVEFAGRVRE
jgi:hypothetical protein